MGAKNCSRWDVLLVFMILLVAEVDATPDAVFVVITLATFVAVFTVAKKIRRWKRKSRKKVALVKVTNKSSEPLSLHCISKNMGKIDRYHLTTGAKHAWKFAASNNTPLSCHFLYA